MNVPSDRVHRQIATILTAWGMAPDLVATITHVMVETDLAGVDSHGVSMLMLYEEMSAAGRLNFRARPKIVRETPVTALIDADHGLGHPASVMGMELAIKKAAFSGVGLVAVRHSSHFGAAGYYAALAPPHGLIGLVTSTTKICSVVPTRSAIPLLGTNPLAFAAPAGRHRPFLLDMSTSTVAVNKIKVYDLNRKPLPAGWVLDEHGQPVTDSAAAFDTLMRRHLGGLTPIGGTAEMSSHKGYGLGVMVQILSATLSGSAFSPIRNRTQKGGDPDDIGHCFLAIDPKTFREPGEFEAEMDAMIDVLRQTPPSNPAEPVLVAGDPEYAAREKRLKDGIPVPETLMEKIRAICGRCGVPFVLAG